MVSEKNVACELVALEYVRRLTCQNSAEAISTEILKVLFEAELIITGSVLGKYNPMDTKQEKIEYYMVADLGDVDKDAKPEIQNYLKQVSVGSGGKVFQVTKNKNYYVSCIVKNESIIGYVLLYISDKQLDRVELIDKLLDVFSDSYGHLHYCKSDALTGLLNRGAFDEMIQQITTGSYHRRNEESNQLTYLALLDIDFFKKVNDSFGHVYGDEVLILFARIIQKTFRVQDWQFRYGGEEFAVILTQVPPGCIAIVVERFRKAVESFSFPQVDSITVSIGFVEVKDDLVAATLLERADQALYYSKQNGRNQAHSYDDLLADGHIEEKDVQTGTIDLF